jgi:Ca2+-binding RTX toxin-like protein
MIGGAGNDIYFVDNPGDVVVENPGQGSDAVFASVNYALTADVETLVLQGSANLNGTGNALANSMFGNSGNNTLDAGAGADVLTGNAGNDTFAFTAGQANGDTVVDFIGNGAAAGDSLRFVGYGPGATFTNIDATHWQVNYNGGASHEARKRLPSRLGHDRAFGRSRLAPSVQAAAPRHPAWAPRQTALKQIFRKISGVPQAWASADR